MHQSQSMREIYFCFHSEISHTFQVVCLCIILLVPNSIFLNLLSPWSRTALSPAGWPVSWQCWVCWGTSPTQSTWPTRWIGCGGNTRTHRSLQWSPCPGWWSGWPPMSFWSGDTIEGAGGLITWSEQKPACLKVTGHHFTIRMLPLQKKCDNYLSISQDILKKFCCFLTRCTFLKWHGSQLNLNACRCIQSGQRWTEFARDSTLSHRLLRLISINASSLSTLAPLLELITTSLSESHHLLHKIPASASAPGRKLCRVCDERGSDK